MSGTQTVTPGNWITQTINGMQYDVLLPANYNASIKYPTVLYLHALDMGTDPADLVPEVNAWFNTTTFRTDYPSIVVMPLLDQTADPSGQTINFGGVSTADTAGETNAIAALKQVQAQYSVDPSRIYVTGNSMGGIGTEDMIIKYNAYTGTEGKIFAAGLSLAGADYGQGYPQPNAAVVTALKNVPFMAIHGGQDTQVPLAWDQNLYAAEQAIGGDMIYTQNNSLSHDVWDTYYPQDGAGTPLGWLFSQSATGTIVTPPVVTPPAAETPSANDTVVLAGSKAAITDASGNLWTITSGGQVAVNGTTDATTANVTELAYVNGTIWQENASKLWWGETKPNDSWAPAAGTATSPLPAAPVTPPVVTPPATKTPSANDTVVLAGSKAAITDASGNLWTITSTGQVAVNGTTDAATANVTELAYVNGTIWQENASKLWWGETKPNDSWAPATGTATSPLPATPPVVTPPVVTPPATKTPSANDTVVVAGSKAAITDASGNLWTITSGGQVAVNGTTDATTAGVTELAYVNGTIWQENSNKLWWGETKPNDSWAPAAGTATSPLPAAPITPPPAVSASPNDTVVLAGSAAAITDVSGHEWTITAGGQVAINGAADTATANVIELAYVNGTIWQENAGNLWWGETTPNDSWAPAAGTATSPLPATAGSPPPVVTPPVVTPPVTSGTRDPSQTPFASTSVFNLPLGSGAQWQANAQLSGANAFINTADGSGYNENIYTGTASDPLVTVTNTAGAGGTPGTFQVHIPAGAVPAPGSDETLSVDDTTSDTWYSFGGFQWTGTNTATVSQGSGESDFGSGITVANSNWDEGVGTLRESDLQSGSIDHMLRMELPIDMLESYSKTSVSTLAPYAWPQTQEDGFAINGNGGPPYSGTIPFGVTIGIPASAVEPAAVTANAGANMLWKALQDHGAMVRDSGGSGNTVIFQADQTVSQSDPLIQGMEQYSAQIMAATEILANQGPNSVNGGGTPIVPLDPAPSDAPAAAVTAAVASAPVSIAATQANATISQSQVSVLATGGSHMLFISGTGDSVSMSGGSDTITDTGSANTYVIPAAGQGYDTFTGTAAANILTIGDTLDLRPALAATNWNGAASTLPGYLTVADTAAGAVLSVAPTSGGVGVAVATIGGATNAAFSDLLAHAVT
nr:hypothetical protein [uncultured Rhodopila sp.]